MGAKVFISCGQRKDKREEMSTAQEVKKWLEKKGYTTYVATNEQELQDVDIAILNNLLDSDYFLFIDFKREKIAKIKNIYRGSLFTHQELALVYYLGFENTILLQQKWVELEGFLRYMKGESKKFKNYNEVLTIVQKEVENRWNIDYCRNLIAGGIGRTENPVFYQDHLTHRWEHIWACRIDNKRKDRVAQNAVAILKKIKFPDGETKRSPDLEFLKWSGHIGYSRSIFPQGYGSFDLFGIPVEEPTKIYLHSSMDVSPRRSIIENPGIYYLTYQVFAEGFPLLTFAVKFNLTGNLKTTLATIEKSSTNSKLVEEKFGSEIKLSDSNVHFTGSKNDKSGIDMHI